VSDSTVLVGAGAFGERVAQLLAGRAPGRRVVAVQDLDSAARARPAALVLAVGRPAPALCRHADELAYEIGFPWLPVLAETSHLRIGPWISPPHGPCFECYHTRRLQHDRQLATTLLVHRACDDDADYGPFGHLPHHARLAAGLADTILAAVRAGSVSRFAGRVTSARLATGTITTSHVVPCHFCDRCAGSADTAQATTARIAGVVARLRGRSPHAYA
jgi:bacteriocin biosynthesis cyclodehydratase domain-containing protein